MTKRYFFDENKWNFPDFIKDLNNDDLILLGIILFLMGDGCEDKELLLMLGALFISGKLHNDEDFL